MESQTPASNNIGPDAPATPTSLASLSNPAPYDESAFDESYYLTLGETYDVMRPVRKALRRQFLFLPRPRTVVVFGLDLIQNLSLWRRAFDTVYAYDINPHIGRKLSSTSFASHFFLQNLALPFAPRCQGHVCSCYWLFEHLPDPAVLQVCANMMAHAPINIIRLTAGDDPNYYRDPTHQNCKSLPAWNTLLSSFYVSQGWAPISRVGNIFSFARSGLQSSISALDAHISYQLTSMWAPYTPTAPISSDITQPISPSLDVSPPSPYNSP